MKKILAMLTAMALVVAMTAGCGSDKKQDKAQDVSEPASSQELTEDTLGQIVTEAAEIPEGTAGSSLKVAALSAKIASFLAASGYNEKDTETLKEELLEKYNALDDDAKANLDHSFTDAFELLDKAIIDGDFDSIKGQFEDAGVADGLDTVMKVPGLAESYNAFKSAYLSIGNSND